MIDKLIPKEEINDLKPASEVKDVADKAVEIQEQAAVARLINYAANTGDHSALWQHPLSPELRTILEGQGYKVTRKSQSIHKPIMDNEWTISWF